MMIGAILILGLAVARVGAGDEEDDHEDEEEDPWEDDDKKEEKVEVKEGKIYETDDHEKEEPECEEEPGCDKKIKKSKWWKKEKRPAAMMMSEIIEEQEQAPLGPLVAAQSAAPPTPSPTLVAPQIQQQLDRLSVQMAAHQNSTSERIRELIGPLVQRANHPQFAIFTPNPSPFGNRIQLPNGQVQFTNSMIQPPFGMMGQVAPQIITTSTTPRPPSPVDRLIAQLQREEEARTAPAPTTTTRPTRPPPIRTRLMRQIFVADMRPRETARTIGLGETYRNLQQRFFG